MEKRPGVTMMTKRRKRRKPVPEIPIEPGSDRDLSGHLETMRMATLGGLLCDLRTLKSGKWRLRIWRSGFSVPLYTGTSRDGAVLVLIAKQKIKEGFPRKNDGQSAEVG